MAKKKRDRPVGNVKKGKLLADQADALTDYAAKAYIAADDLRIKTKPVKQFPLDEDERETLAEIPALPAKLKKKLAKKDVAFTIVDLASMVMAISESFVDAEAKEQLALLLISKKLIGCLQANIVMPDLPAKAKKASPSDTVYQFKITLLESHPPIWRRIQVKDCTLDNLHECIQTSMGWTNSHLHHFKIGEQQYGDPMLMEEDFEEFGYRDSTTTMLSDILPKNGKRLLFQYEYDFGDSWHHEVVFEGVVRAESKAKYPLCLEGERACPPEDVGGVRGYADFLNAIQDKSHEEREAMFEWVSGWFDPEEFDPVTATKSMKKGLPDWRSESWI